MALALNWLSVIIAFLCRLSFYFNSFQLNVDSFFPQARTSYHIIPKFEPTKPFTYD